MSNHCFILIMINPCSFSSFWKVILISVKTNITIKLTLPKEYLFMNMCVFVCMYVCTYSGKVYVWVQVVVCWCVCGGLRLISVSSSITLHLRLQQGPLLNLELIASLARLLWGFSVYLFLPRFWDYPTHLVFTWVLGTQHDTGLHIC